MNSGFQCFLFCASGHAHRYRAIGLGVGWEPHTQTQRVAAAPGATTAQHGSLGTEGTRTPLPEPDILPPASGVHPIVSQVQGWWQEGDVTAFLLFCVWQQRWGAHLLGGMCNPGSHHAKLLKGSLGSGQQLAHAPGISVVLPGVPFMSPRCQEAIVHAAPSFWRRWSPLPGLYESVLKLPSDVPAGHLLGALASSWGGAVPHHTCSWKERGERA